jgi:hypothetical protein
VFYETRGAASAVGGHRVGVRPVGKTCWPLARRTIGLPGLGNDAVGRSASERRRPGASRPHPSFPEPSHSDSRRWAGATHTGRPRRPPDQMSHLANGYAPMNVYRCARRSATPRAVWALRAMGPTLATRHRVRMAEWESQTAPLAPRRPGRGKGWRPSAKRPRSAATQSNGRIREPPPCRARDPESNEGRCRTTGRGVVRGRPGRPAAA